MTLPVILLLLQALSAFPQKMGIKAPAWVIYEQGNALYAGKEYGSALKKYQEALASFYPFPEVEMAIGDVYRQEGELDLAIIRYKKAYELRNSFYIPEMKYEALYRLANVYEDTRAYRDMEDALKTIVAEDKNFSPSETSRLREQFTANYYSKGIDFVLKLYRFPERFSADAHAKLGWFYYRTGNYTTAVTHLLYALTYKVSDAGAYAYEKDVEFQFTTLSAFLGLASKDSVIGGYFQKSEIYKDLYYLAGSVFKSGYPAHARDIWQVLSKYPPAGSYAELSSRQLKAPWTEPLLSIPVKN